jgi:hypothetical protein
MAEDQKNSQKEIQSCCEGMPFGGMMRKMLEAKKSGQPFNCAEVMSQMMKMWGGAAKKEKESAPDTP